MNLRRQYWVWVLMALLMSACAQKKPNVVFILVDDLGWNDVGYMGSTFHETPNVDQLSKEGLVFTQAYAASSVCSPTRAALMTGKHPVRLGITDWIPGANPPGRKLKTPTIPNQLALEETTLAEVFKENGYKTFFAGKWHLGSKGYYPEDQGFDLNLGGFEMGQPPDGYFSPYNNPKLSDGPDGEYLTDRLTEESIRFITENKTEPFLLCLNFYTVHTPIQANPEHVERFNSKLARTTYPQEQVRPEHDASTNLFQNDPDYASMVYSMDENVGRLVDKLKELSLYDNTIIVFTSDNGGLSTLPARYRKAPTSVLPLRAGKGWLYEGGIRIPLIIKNRDTRNGSTTEAPIVSQDLFPTLIGLAGLTYKPAEALDGTDFTGYFEQGTLPEKNEIFWSYPHYHGSGWTPGAAIRVDNYKLIEFYETGEIELYNLSEDEGEMHNLANSEPEVARTLRKRLHELRQEAGAAPVSENTDYVPDEPLQP